MVDRCSYHAGVKPDSPLDRLLRRSAGVLRLTDGRRGLLRTLVLMAAVYLLLAWLHPGRGQRVLRHALMLGTTFSLLILYGIAGNQIRVLSGSARRLVLSGFALLAMCALLAPAFHSSDVHAYAQIGQLQSAYGSNPYVTVPSDIPDWRADPVFAETWKDSACVYGFLFAHVTNVVSWLGAGDPERIALLFKLLAAALLCLIGITLFCAVKISIQRGVDGGFVHAFVGHKFAS